MTVAQLIERLKQFDPAWPVGFEGSADDVEAVYEQEREYKPEGQRHYVIVGHYF